MNYYSSGVRIRGEGLAADGMDVVPGVSVKSSVAAIVSVGSSAVNQLLFAVE